MNIDFGYMIEIIPELLKYLPITLYLAITLYGHRNYYWHSTFTYFGE